METDVTFLDCPEYAGPSGAVRCGLPAEVQYWYTVQSSDGPLVSARICCPRGHWFNGPLESLICPDPIIGVCPPPSPARPRSSPPATA
jgi:hypothetical protein